MRNLDKFRGCLIGGAAGDALGYEVEFMDTKSIRQRFGASRITEPDISTIRKKLKEYVALGILDAEKAGRELHYRRVEDGVPLNAWTDTVAFFSEADPLGVIGSTILDKLETAPEHFQFKHHYMLCELYGGEW